MFYLLVFIFGMVVGFLIFSVTHKFIQYPGELVISKKDGIYLVMGEDFEEKTKFAMAVTLKIHSV